MLVFSKMYSMIRITTLTHTSHQFEVHLILAESNLFLNKLPSLDCESLTLVSINYQVAYIGEIVQTGEEAQSK